MGRDWDDVLHDAASTIGSDPPWQGPRPATDDDMSGEDPIDQAFPSPDAHTLLSSTADSPTADSLGRQWQIGDRVAHDAMRRYILGPGGQAYDPATHERMLARLRPTAARGTTNLRSGEALDRFGADVAKLCAARGLSQRRLAAMCGVDQGTISRMMRGLAPGLRLEAVARILLALEGHVVGGTDDRWIELHDD